MRTSTIYRTRDRLIIDIRWWSFYIWFRPKFWARWIDTTEWRFQIGPLEVVRHGLCE